MLEVETAFTKKIADFNLEVCKKIWSLATSYQQLLDLNIDFLAHRIAISPSHYEPVWGETSLISHGLIGVNRLGFHTLSSQPGHIIDPSCERNHPSHSLWATDNYGRGYIEGMLPKAWLPGFLDLARDYNIYVHVYSQRKSYYKGQCYEAKPGYIYYVDTWDTVPQKATQIREIHDSEVDHKFPNHWKDSISEELYQFMREETVKIDITHPDYGYQGVEIILMHLMQRLRLLQPEYPLSFGPHVVTCDWDMVDIVSYFTEYQEKIWNSLPCGIAKDIKPYIQKNDENDDESSDDEYENNEEEHNNS